MKEVHYDEKELEIYYKDKFYVYKDRITKILNELDIKVTPTLIAEIHPYITSDINGSHIDHYGCNYGDLKEGILDLISLKKAEKLAYNK